MNLSQAEIDAMMTGKQAPAETGELSQAEIDAMMSGGKEASPHPPVRNTADMLTPQEIDTLGEVGNICMGAVATTMYTLLDRRVEITIPEVSIDTMGQVMSGLEPPCVVAEVGYVEGVQGKNLLLLKVHDVAMITDMLMGGEGVVDKSVELSELHMSAMNEIMNQMIAASATALSQFLSKTVNISTPNSVEVTNENGSSGIVMGNGDTIIKIDFGMEVEGLLSARFIQMMPYEHGRQLVETLLELYNGKSLSAVVAETAVYAPPPAAPVAPPTPPPAPREVFQQPVPPPPATAQQMPALGQQMAGTGFERPHHPVPGELVDVRPLQFESFDDDKGEKIPKNSGMDIISNIPLEVSAELGTACKNLSEVMGFKPGMVITLNKAAGDPVDIMVNGKYVARGEVVVIDDNYGIRITDLPSK